MFGVTNVQYTVGTETGKRVRLFFVILCAFVLGARGTHSCSYTATVVINLASKGRGVDVVPEVRARVAKNISEIRTVCKKCWVGYLITRVSTGTVGSYTQETEYLLHYASLYHLQNRLHTPYLYTTPACLHVFSRDDDF